MIHPFWSLTFSWEIMSPGSIQNITCFIRSVLEGSNGKMFSFHWIKPLKVYGYFSMVVTAGFWQSKTNENVFRRFQLNIYLRQDF